MSAQFTPEQERQVRDAAASQQEVRCPVCAVVMTARSIGGGSFGLGYARQRQWLLCPQCHRSVIFDVKRGTRN